MAMNEQLKFIEEWSKNRGLNCGDSSKQLIKLMEEVGELAEAHNKGFQGKQTDSIGDIFVALTIYAQQCGLSFEGCVGMACREISNRHGKTINGVFIKESDLTND